MVLKNKAGVIIAIGTALALLFSGCAASTTSGTQEKGAVKTSTQKVQRGNLRIGLTADGRINLSLTNLNFEVSGIVKKISVKNGQSVKAGQILAELDDTELKQAVAKAENAYAKAKANYTDAVNQRDINIMSEKIKLDELEESYKAKPEDTKIKANYELQKKRYNNLVNNNASIQNARLGIDDAKNNLDAAKENLSKAVLKAPSDGRIINIAYKVGELVDNSKAAGSSSAFMVLCDPAAIYMKASVTEGDIKGIQAGQQMRVSVDAAELENIEGEVTEIKNIPKVDQSGIVSYEVTGKLKEPNGSIMDGMSCVITFLKKEKAGVLLIPNKAVSIADGKQFVNVQASDGKVEKRQVTCGLTNGIQTEVIEGLSEGETVVIGGTSK